MDSEYINAEFTLPKSDTIYSGTLHITNEDMFFVLRENPNGRNSWNSIEIIYAKTANGFYSCVECYLYKTDHYSYFYFTISELYKGDKILLANFPIYTKLVAEVHFLNFWLHPRLHEFEYKEMQVDKIRISKSKIFKYKLTDDLTIGFESYSNIKTGLGQLKLKEKSVVFIESNKNTTRQFLFNKFYSFLILYTLFLKKVPGTLKLKFGTNIDFTECLNTNKKINESPFDTLIRLSEIHNFNDVIFKYFSNSSIYNSIIQLWQVSFELIDPEIAFLHLTQSLELFHKSFHQNNENVRIEIKNEMNLLFPEIKKIKTKKWLQKMIYYHLFKISDDLELNIPFPSPCTDFINKLTNSRNYYTHYTDGIQHWNYHELFKINQFLKLWVRCLILENLDIEKEVILKISKQKIAQQDSVIFENKYSMRFGNWFTR